MADIRVKEIEDPNKSDGDGKLLRPKFVHLHNHSEMSLLDGISKPKEMAARAVELGSPAIALTDHGRMSGAIEFYTECKNAGVKPIIGIEAYMTPMGHHRSERVSYDVKEMRGKPGHERNNYHLILLAKNYEGYKNLCALSTASFAEGYYYKPRIDFELLCEHKEGLVVSSACILGMVSHYLWCDDYARAREVALRFQDVFGEDYYLEIMNHELDMERKIMAPIRQLGRELGIKVVATNDSHFVRKEDHKLQKTMMMLGMHKSWSDASISGSFFDDDDDYSGQKAIEGEDNDSDPIFEMPPHLYLKDYDEMLAVLRYGGGEDGVAEAELATTLEIADKCDCELPIIDPSDMSAYHTPVYPLETDSQYGAFKAAGFKFRQSTVDEILKELHEDGQVGDTLEELLDDHQLESLKFLLWTCENGLEKRVRPKIEAKGEPLPMEFWCENPPEGFRVTHMHNSPDELWIKEQLGNGLDVEGIMDLYRQRLDYEVGVVVRKGFIDYFSVVSAYTRFTKEQGSFVGAGRGSGAGSLLNYLLDITSIDPLPNGLLFERFLNPARKGYPDIDIDFSKDFRDNTLKPYLRKIYGEDCAASVSTYMYLWGKAALRAAARVLFNPPESVDIATELCDLIDDTPKLDLNNHWGHDKETGELLDPVFWEAGHRSRKHEQVVELALQLQGRVSGESIHASAFILSPFPILDQMPMSVTKEERDRAQTSGEPIREYLIQYDGTITQDKLGFVKLDLLCLKDLELLELANKFVEKRYGCRIDPESLPMDDKAVFDLILSGHNSGIFQFDGSPVALRLIQQSGANSIGDWSAVNALNRPGPLQMGYDQQFIDGKRHPEKVTYFAPAAEKYLKETYGSCTYQEQIMLLSQDKSIVGFNGGQADHLRKCTSKKKKEELAKMEIEMKEVAASNGVPEAVVNEFWEICKAAGSYSFNHSHSLAYAVVAYRGAFIKAHFPDCFLAAICTLKPQMKKVNKIPSYLEEARQLGITVKPPHVNYSQNGFDVPERGVIAFGLGGIKRVGKSAEPIIAEREANGPYRDFTDFCVRCPREVGKAPLEALINAGALDGLGWSRMAMSESVDQIVQFRKDYFAEKRKTDEFEDSLFADFGFADDAASRNEAAGDGASSQRHDIQLVAPFDIEYDTRRLIAEDKRMFGMYFHGDPADFYELAKYRVDKELRARLLRQIKSGDFGLEPRYTNLSEIEELPDKTLVEVVGSVVECKAFRTKAGKMMGTIRIRSHGLLEESRHGFAPAVYTAKLTAFSRTWSDITPPLPDDVVRVVGRLNKDPEYQTSIIIDTIEQLPSDGDIYRRAGANDIAELAVEKAEMESRIAQLADPTSDAYRVPFLDFKTRDDADAFLDDPDTFGKYADPEGRVVVTVGGDVATARVVRLRKTMGLVRHAVRFGAVASKAQLPAAADSEARMRMMNILDRRVEKREKAVAAAKAAREANDAAGAR